MNVTVLKVYNLLNPNGSTLQLQLGIDRNVTPRNGNEDSGLRWRFVGREIPMPVRSGYWFNGMTPDIMLDWLKGNGWVLHTCVDARTHHVVVYPLHGRTTETISVDRRMCEGTFNAALRYLVDNNHRLRATAVYAYAHECSISEARAAVDRICKTND